MHLLGGDTVGQGLGHRPIQHGDLQLVAQQGRIGQAAVGVPGESLGQGQIKSLGDLILDLAQLDLATLMGLASEQLNQQRRDGVHISSGIKGLAIPHLWRQAEEGIGGGPLGPHIRLRRQCLGQSKVRDLEQIGQDDDVLGFQTTMHHQARTMANPYAQLGEDRLHFAQ